ncbi:MAG: DUF262 domain-containing protein [Prevotella sp.]|nr:DUF262 domain-containing protein [Prevotella sp.]
MMLTEDIVLPEYQRHFVWQERDVKRLIQSLKDGQFVQPVTIALYDDGTNKYNLILDGQQRLTSLLLAYLGYFPNKKMFEAALSEKVASEDDSAADDVVQNQTGILWRFSEILKYGKTKVSVVNKIGRDEKYTELTDSIFTDLDDNFFNKTFLGFSYVVPESTIVSDVQKNFSQLFRNINYFGKKLEAMDSRKSLYYQNPNLTKYFEGKCQDGKDALCGLMIIEDLQPCIIDFVRYLSILSQFHISTRTDAKDVLVGYSAYSSRESFYADYVSYILNIEQEDRINKFDGFDFNIVFPTDIWKSRFDVMYEAITKLKPSMPLKDGKSFSAWYEADYWLFGLIYHILFDGKQLKETLTRINKAGRIKSLQEEISDRIRIDKKDPSFAKNTNRLGYIRSRLVASYSIYSQYVQ